MYFANPSTQPVRDAMTAGQLGMIRTPKQGNRLPGGAIWCADNGCFGKGYPGDDKWFAWLVRHADDAGDCVFAVAPDVVGDAKATLLRSRSWLAPIRRIGYPAALVSQDGLDESDVPWDEFDALFIGGSTAWKFADETRQLVAAANTRGKWVHMGRVNSRKRLAYAREIGCDSADGTFIAFGPDKNLPLMTRWLREVNAT